MALTCTIDRNNSRGDELADAIEMIRDGLAVIVKYDGMRAETVSVSAENFGTVFGITSNPQAMSDRMGAIAAKTYTGLADFINATIAD